MRKKGKWLLRKHTSCLTGDGDGDGDCDGDGEGDGGGEGEGEVDDDDDGEGDDDGGGDGDGEVAHGESLKKNIVHDHIIQKLPHYFFIEGAVTNPAICLVLYPVSIFLSLPTGNGNAFVSRRVHPFIRCYFS